MKKIFAFIFCLFCFLCPVSIQNVYADDDFVFLGGFPAGFTINERGAYIVGISDVITENGLVSPAKIAGLNRGDRIIYIDNNEINNSLDIERVVTNSNKVEVKILRDDSELSLIVFPAKDLNGKYRLGVLIRDEINGIGTTTFIKNDLIASLGHPILNNDGNIVDVKNGEIYLANITGCKKGQKGVPGELKGYFLREKIADIFSNNITGVYGNIIDSDIYNNKTIQVGEGKIGSAKIYTTIEGVEPKLYDISIVKVDNFVNDVKNFVIKINDKNLIDVTNGIVQGMSGSPIIQDNKIVGAVTHVFINDPERGYGISIKKMLNNI